MYTDFNLESHVSALLFLTASAGLVLFGLGAIVAWFLHRTRLLKLCVVLAVLGVGLYLALLGAFALGTHNVVLERSAEKHFCELDCHLAYSVIGVEQQAALGEGAVAVQAKGKFVVVRMKVRFDESTISPQRPRDATLTAYPLRVQLLTQDKRWIEPSEAGQSALGMVSAPKPLVPGESTEIALIFDVPAGQQPWLLLMTQDDPVARWMIGSENSWLHGRSAWRVD